VHITFNNNICIAIFNSTTIHRFTVYYYPYTHDDRNDFIYPLHLSTSYFFLSFGYFYSAGSPYDADSALGHQQKFIFAAFHIEYRRRRSISLLYCVLRILTILFSIIFWERTDRFDFTFQRGFRCLSYGTGLGLGL